MTTILGVGASSETRRLHDPASTRHWMVMVVAGIAITLVGSDLALLWIPARLGTPDWEFGTVSTTLDGMPLGTVGFALIAVGAVAGNAAMQFALRKSILKTAIFAAIYITLYAWLGWFLWRSSRPRFQQH